VDRHTLKICEFVARYLIEKHCCVHVYSIEQFNRNPSDFDCLIIGASVRYGKHNHLIRDFILKNKKLLGTIKTAFFSVNLVARNEGKDRPDNNPYLIKFLHEINWQPDIAEVFAGQLDYSRYSFLDRLMIKLIMKLTKGPAKTNGPIIYTNRERVK
jgi:menaquinone-dependent protoporphyrinogen oxidase